MTRNHRRLLLWALQINGRFPPILLEEKVAIHLQVAIHLLFSMMTGSHHQHHKLCKYLFKD